MEIHKQLNSITGSKDPGATAGKLGSDITAPSREIIREGSDPERLDKKDRIELSQTVKSLEAQVQNDTGSADRAERVQALRAAYEAGTLNDAEIVERAARGLLKDS
ncbi:MAG: anti-sigma28 factor (negative regulator of flagellin synthesis) [Chlamydiales bacterium]|jgi:anti-sigma28 factor (negative regulator of flagellin synthesis)